MLIIFRDFEIFHQSFFSVQMKWSLIICKKHGLCKLPDELSNNLDLRILENPEILEKPQSFIELHPSAQSSFKNKTFVNTSKLLLKNRNWIFVVATYITKKLGFVSNVFQNCLWKQAFASNLPPHLFKINFFDIFGNSKVFNTVLT